MNTFINIVALSICFSSIGCSDDDCDCPIPLDGADSAVEDSSDSNIEDSNTEDAQADNTETLETSGPIIVKVGEGGSVFVPGTVLIRVGETVRWEWSASDHSVTSGSDCVIDNKFCSPANTSCDVGETSSEGYSYEHTFTEQGAFPYFCFTHCSDGMIGAVNVGP